MNDNKKQPLKIGGIILLIAVISSQIVIGIVFSFQNTFEEEWNEEGLDDISSDSGVVISSKLLIGYPLYKHQAEVIIPLQPIENPCHLRVRVYLIDEENQGAASKINLFLIMSDGSEESYENISVGQFTIYSNPSESSMYHGFNGRMVVGIRFEKTMYYSKGFSLNVEYVSLYSVDE